MKDEVIKMVRGAYKVLTNSRDELFEQCGIISRKEAPPTLGSDLFYDFTWDHFEGEGVEYISCDRFPLKKHLKYIEFVDAQSRNRREEILTSWDRDFIVSMRVKTLGDMSRNWLSRKQYDTLGRIHNKALQHHATVNLNIIEKQKPLNTPR